MVIFKSTNAQNQIKTSRAEYKTQILKEKTFRSSCQLKKHIYVELGYITSLSNCNAIFLEKLKRSKVVKLCLIEIDTPLIS